MSASRTRLTVAATLLAAFVLATPGWAQYGAYGARAVVEHNDLRWFEPIDLDIDGQMPRRDAGYFFSADKTWETVVNGKYEIGDPGRTVQSEQIFRPPTAELTILFVDQLTDVQFIANIPDPQDQVQAALSYGGLIIEDAAGNDITREITSFDNLQDRLRADPGDANFAMPGGDPDTYEVVNSIRDAFPDAGFAWGERYEFGYSDGEQGWMVTILDGPESVAGGTFGAGEGAPYFSQSGTEIPGRDPYFDNNGIDDDLDGQFDGDGEQGSSDIYALGFGSVAVNFDLTDAPDLLRGFRDYDNGNTPWTTTGPILYVGNVGGTFTELLPDTGVVGGTGAIGTSVNTSITALQSFRVLLDNNPNGDAGAGLENSGNQSYTTVATELSAVATANTDNAAIIGQVNFINSLVGIVDPTTFDPDLGVAPDPPTFTAGDAQDGLDNAAQVTAADNTAELVIQALITLNQLLSADTDADADVTVTNEDRQADDLNGNSQPGFTRIFGLVDDEFVEVGRVIDFGDLHTFNVFFDEVTTRNITKIDGVELMRMHELSTRHKLEQGRWDDLRFSWGVRFLDIEDDFYFQGLGSVLGRTTVATEVENQIIGPQIGLKWTRRDGPWNFVLEGRGMLGYNRTDVDQEGIFGEELVPGALNRSAIARTTASVDGEVYNEFSPVAELRAMLKYRLAESVSLQAGYTAKYIGNVHRSYDATAWRAPTFGINDITTDLFTNGLSFGVELRH